jgi:hypothetical protein
VNDNGPVAEASDEFWTVRRHQHGPVLALVEHFGLAFALKILVADKYDLVD